MRSSSRYAHLVPIALAVIISFVPPLLAQEELARSRQLIDAGIDGGPMPAEIESVAEVNASGTEGASDHRAAKSTTTTAGGASFDQTNLITGAYTFSIPIDTPPGVNGLAPSVAIQYSSDNGRFNVISTGFNLSTDDCIWRSSPAFTALNGETTYSRGAPTFSVSDTFYVGGQRMVLCDTAPGGLSDTCPSGTYRTNSNNFVRIEKQPAGVPEGWKVTRKDGSIAYYNEIRRASGRPSGFINDTQWCISSVERDGNQISYRYADFGNGLRLVDAIDYGGQGSFAQPATNQIWRIAFEWADRSDIVDNYSSGTRVTLSKRLSAISVLRLPSSTRMRYVLGYEPTPSATGQYRLSTVTQSGADGTSLPAYQFTYAPDATGFSAQDAPVGLSGGAVFSLPKRDRIHRANDHDERMNYDLISNLSFGMIPVDINADGFTDLVRHDTWGNQVWINTGQNDWVLDTNWTNKMAPVPSFGRFEILESTFPHQDLNSSANADGYARSIEYIDHGVKFVDLNGDGYQDIAQAAILNTGHQYNGAGAWYCDTSTPYVWVAIWDPAMNGGTGGYSTTLGEGYRSFIAANGLYFVRQDSSAIESPGCWVSFPTGTSFADVNGDGLPDLIQSYGSNPAGGDVTPIQSVYLNTGASFTPAPSGSFTLPGLFNELYRYHYRDKGFRLTDLNGDGLADIVQQLSFADQKPGGEAAYTEANVWMNTGTNWEFRTDLSTALRSAHSIIQPLQVLRRRFGYINDTFYGGWANIPSGGTGIDVNGDGLEDLMAPVQGVASNKALLFNGRTWSDTSAFAAPLFFQHTRGYPNNILSSTLCPSDGYTIGCLLNAGAVDYAARFLNINGDGIPDILQYGSYWQDGVGQVSAGPRIWTSNTRFDRDLVTQITNPMGGKTAVTYEQVSSLSSHQDHEMPMPKVVTKSISVDNGRTGGAANGAWSATSNFSYYGGRYDSRLRGFAGFRSVVKESPESDGSKLYTTSWFKNGSADFCIQGVLERKVESREQCKTIYGPGGTESYSNCVQFMAPTITPTDVSNLGIYNQTTWQFQSCPTGAGALNGPFFKPATAIVQNTYEPGIPDKTLQTSQTFTYDRFGNLLKTRDLIGSTVVRTNQTTYSYPDYNRWLVDRPCAQRLLDGANRLVRETTYTYDSQAASCTLGAHGWPTLEVTVGYDTAGLENARVTSAKSYTDFGNVEALTDGKQHTTLFHWDDPQFPEILMRSKENAKQHTVLYEYDLYGNLDRQIDENNITTDFEYDGLHRRTLERAIAPDGVPAPEISYTFEGYGNPNVQKRTSNSLLDGTRVVTEEEYFDGLGRAYLKLRRGGSITVANASAWNARGDVSVLTAPYLGSAFDLSKPATTTTYDPIGRVTRIELPGGHFSTQSYGLFTFNAQTFGWQDTVQHNAPSTDLRKHVFQDGLGRMVRVVECEAGTCSDPTQGAVGTLTTRYDYDVMDSPTDIYLSDGVSRIKRFYDGLGRLIGVKDPDISNCADANFDALGSGCPSRYHYDAAGNLDEETDPKYNLDRSGVITTMLYDELNRVVSRTPTIGGVSSNFSYEYDNGTIVCDGLTNPYPKGELVRQSYSGRTYAGGAESSSNCFVYDSLGRTKRKAVQVAIDSTNAAAAFGYEYLNGGALSKLYLPNPTEILTYGYDDLGRQRSLSSSLTGSLVSNAQFDALGRVTAANYGSGLSAQRDYRVNAGGGAVADLRLGRIRGFSGQTALLDLSYDYDPVGNVKSIVDGVQGREESYLYDPLNRVSVYLLNGAESQTFTYSGLGNRRTITNVTPGQAELVVKKPSPKLKRMVQADPEPMLVPTSTTLTRLFGSQWSGVGGTHALLCSSSGTISSCAGAQNSYTYDVNGNLIRRNESGSIANFHFGPNGKLKHSDAPSGVTEYFYGPSEERVAMRDQGVLSFYLDSSYELRNGARTINYQLNGETIATKEGTAPLKFHFVDHLGSMRVAARDTGTVDQRVNYAPFGEPSVSGAARFRFNGTELDSRGLYDYKARNYSADLGQFLSPDSIVPDFANPQSMNRYGYAYNNGVNYTDPSGHMPLLVGLFASFVANTASGALGGPQVVKISFGADSVALPPPSSMRVEEPQSRITNSMLMNPDVRIETEWVGRSKSGDFFPQPSGYGTKIRLALKGDIFHTDTLAIDTLTTGKPPIVGADEIIVWQAAKAVTEQAKSAASKHQKESGVDPNNPVNRDVDKRIANGVISRAIDGYRAVRNAFRFPNSQPGPQLGDWGGGFQAAASDAHSIWQPRVPEPPSVRIRLPWEYDGPVYTNGSRRW